MDVNKLFMFQSNMNANCLTVYFSQMQNNPNESEDTQEKRQRSQPMARVSEHGCQSSYKTQRKGNR